MSPSQMQATGERIYVDIGHHPELSTAEEISFIGAAHRLLAGHVKMARLYEQSAEVLRERNPGLRLQKVNLIANTTDSSWNSWASHENILAPRSLEPERYIGALAVHRLSRIVWSGAGYIWVSRDGQHFEYCLSEKADQIWDVASTETTRCRPLVNLRDTPYADAERFRRIHGTAGESVVSPFANALRLASESIILRACELGADFSDLMPDNTNKAIRDISHDPSLQAKVRLKDGRLMSGLDLQREVAERSIQAAADADYLTAQEREWGNKWLSVLDDLATDPERCASRVDWVVKRNLVLRELRAKRDSGQSEAAVAWTKAVEYHRLLPDEGMGMKLLRKGFFEDSPSNAVLEGGLPMPETRARLRGEAVRRLGRLLLDEDVYFNATWEIIRSEDHPDSVYRLQDPYNTDPSGLNDFLDRIAA
jgi:proteasome accessory factor A